MKVTIRYYPILDGKLPHFDTIVRDFIDKSEFVSEYMAAWYQLLACKVYRVISMSILNHIGDHTKLMYQLSNLAPQASIKPCWYLFRGCTIGVARSSKDMTFVCVAVGENIFAAGGVFLDKTEDGQVHYDINNISDQTDENVASFAVMFGRVIPAFIEFAETETIVLNSAMPGKRKVYLDEKYITNAKLDVEIIDSTWYRELVHIGDFNVTGHFRLQPYGPMNSLRKLIYVKDFVKHDYHRIAKKEKVSEN